MKQFFPNAILSALAALSLPAAGWADEAENLKFFESKIRPLLASECFDCHGEDDSKGGLRVDHVEFLLAGGDTGPALVAGNPEESLFIEAVRRTDPDFSMPPKKALSGEQVALLEEWVAKGAPWPEEKVVRSDQDEHGFTAEDYEWWAAQPLAEVSVPAVKGDWARNEVDRFILEKLEENHLKPADAAAAPEMVRRIYFDLHGLPPTDEAAAEFALAYAEDADAAIAALVDELLESPRYGERWGQHWLDVVRYAESDGYRADDLRPDAWRYRDYVIRSINEDKPYNQFVREQLAADEFAPDDPDTVIATAFLRHGIYEWNQRNSRMQWELILTEMTNVMGEAFLGLGIGCAECHDHKFDPILQKDYFAFQAFLNSTWWPEHEPLGTAEEKAAFERRQAEWEAATVSIREELDALKASRIENARQGVVKQFPDDLQEIYAKPAEEQTAHEKQLASLVQRQVDHRFRRFNWEKEFEKKEEELARYNELSAELAKFDDLKPEPLPLAFITTDIGAEPAETLLKRRSGTEVVEPAFLTLLGQDPPKIEPNGRTTGRRTALADWVADEDNPFTTRVIVNRIWQRHFNQGLVPTPNDFGRLGEEPSHPELLDWLTRKFLDEGWRMKPLHRLIMTSATYRQTAQREPTTDEVLVDSQNRLLWRFPPQRLDAEQIRDAMLALSGELVHREGGPSVDGKAKNRSVYIRKRRNTQDALLGDFDVPSGFGSAPDRVSTTTPNQSLNLVNGEWTLERATAFAKRLLAGSSVIGADEVRSAYRIAYGREPLTAEVEGALAFIEAQIGIAENGGATNYKYPDETGLRPSEQAFRVAAGIDTGKHALWLQPGSRFERLQALDLKLPGEAFTIEAIANLDNIHSDSSVNTLFSRWNGSADDAGFTFGVTSEKSRYQPRNFIMQLIGDDFQSNRIYEVVASGLRFPFNKPVYLAASVVASPEEGNVTNGTVTFYLKDLSDPDSPLQVETVSHQIVGGLASKPEIKTLIGGRDQKGHLWDGQLARLVVSRGALAAGDLLINGGTERDEIIDWNFNGDDGKQPAPQTAWLRGDDKSPDSAYPPALLAALTDFCQALLNSNEFLYLH